MTRAAPMPAWITEAVTGLPALVTVGETAKFLRCHERTIFRALAAGKIAAARVGDGAAKTLIARTEIARYLAERAA